MPMQVHTVASMVTSLPSDSAFFIELEGHKFPMRLRRGHADAKTIVFLFHGAIDRGRRSVPAFVPFLPGIGKHAHQISISDPTLMMPDAEFSMGWYAGHQDFPVQRLLTTIFKKIQRTFKAEKVIFFGTSVGGFASLYYSWHLPGSICVCGCPQTNIENYYPKHVGNYLSTCWPAHLKKPGTLGDFTSNLCDLYSEKFPNRVIYLQSAGDIHHSQNHMVPFLTACTLSSGRKRLILKSDFWGKLGHSSSIPVPECERWIRAAMSSPSVETDDILMTWHTMSHQAGQPLKRETKAVDGGPSATFDPALIEMNKAVNSWLL
jgi:hypothetical protein